MNNSYCDITTYYWLDHESIGFPNSHVESLKLFRDAVVQPSLQALDDEIRKLNATNDPATDFFIDDYAELYQTTVEGYIIAVQSMWERGLRALLIRRERKLSTDPQLGKLESAIWRSERGIDLQKHFVRLMGIPLQGFYSYTDLDLLQSLASAIRHGDGVAARKVHQLCPKLWFNWFPPGQEIVIGPFRSISSPDGPKHPPFGSITLHEAVLNQMIQSVLWFWEDIDNIQCNSFKNKHPNVIAKLEKWKFNILNRQASRLWYPVDGAFPRDSA